ncbi:MAG: DNA/RNA non-specific endonuclease [bacterium]
MRGVLGAVVVCLMATVLCAAEDEHAIFGKPAGGFSINRKGYSCGYRTKTGCSAWVQYHLTPDYFSQARTLQGERPLYADPDVVASGLSAPTVDDIKNSNMVPLFFFPHDHSLGRGRDCEKEVFSMVNAAPVKTGDTLLKVWYDIDKAARQWARDFKEVWVISGPLFQDDAERTLSRKMAVPSSFYKIVVRKEGGSIKTIAFIVPQNAAGKINEYLSSIENIEKRADLDFFPTMPRSEEKALKKTQSVMWDLPEVDEKGKGGKDKGKGKGKGGPSSTPLPLDQPGAKTDAAAAGKGAPGASAPATGGDGKVWEIDGKYYKSGSPLYGKGGGIYRSEDEAVMLGFTPGN